LKTVRIDPFVEMAFDYFRREHGFDSDDLSDFINGCVRRSFVRTTLVCSLLFRAAQVR
jgi:hypothetical protein